jgi:hypothetical protein
MRKRKIRITDLKTVNVKKGRFVPPEELEYETAQEIAARDRVLFDDDDPEDDDTTVEQDNRIIGAAQRITAVGIRAEDISAEALRITDTPATDDVIDWRMFLLPPRIREQVDACGLRGFGDYLRIVSTVLDQIDGSDINDLTITRSQPTPSFTIFGMPVMSRVMPENIEFRIGAGSHRSWHTMEGMIYDCPAPPDRFENLYDFRVVAGLHWTAANIVRRNSFYDPAAGKLYGLTRWESSNRF